MVKDNYKSTIATLKKREFWIGLATTLVALLVILKVVPWNNINTLMTNKTSNKVVSPIPTTLMANDESTKEAMMKMETSPTITVVPTSTKAKTSLSKLKVLADTTGYYSVVEGDNYYKISTKVCGTGKYFEYIQAENNDQPLHAGDQIIVNCTE